MSNLKTNLAAYIYVLGVSEVINQIDEDPLVKELIGCLVRLEEKLSERNDQSSVELLKIIRQRERINGQKPYGDPELVAATKECALACLEYYKLQGKQNV